MGGIVDHNTPYENTRYNQFFLFVEKSLKMLFSVFIFKPLKRQTRLQQMTFINIFSLFFREDKT